MTKLTKQDLISWGIEVIGNADGEYQIWRTWHKNNSKRIERKQLKISKVVCKHKYGQDKYYSAVSFNAGKIRTITLSRLVYAWYFGEVPANMDVDHIDNDVNNNKLENLQLLTRKENLAKRLIDNDSRYFNQYHTKNMLK